MISRRIRAAVIGAAALMALALLAPSAALAADAPETPDRAALTADNSGDVVVEKAGSLATVNLGDGDHDSVHAHVFPSEGDPVNVGAQQPSEGSFGIDLSLMPAGEVVIAVTDADGELIGWGATELTDDESHAPPEDEGAAEDPVPLWLWVVGGAIVLAAVVFAVRRLRARDRSGTADGSSLN